MKTITNEQAEGLRKLRPRLRQLTRDISDTMSELNELCTHKESHDTECYICLLYQSLSHGSTCLQDIPDTVDEALTRGPDPRAVGR